MCTEVKHGPNPQFDATTYGEFSCRIVGRYTTQNHLVAAGVTEQAFHSTRPVKQMSELLGLRTAFLHWFFLAYEALGGAPEDALEEILHIVDSKRERRFCIPLDDREVTLTEAEYAEWRRSGTLPEGA